MAPQKVSKGRFVDIDESSPKPGSSAHRNHKDLGLSQVDPGLAIGQSGGVVVVMQEFHDESAFDTGDFSVALSRGDRRKQAQQEREAEQRRKKEEEKKAAIALKKEQEAQAAREAAAAKEASRKQRQEEERKQRKEAERAAAEKAKTEQKNDRKNRSVTPAPPPVPAPKVTDAEPPADKPTKKGKGRRSGEAESVPAVAATHSAGAQAVMRDSAVVGIGNVIQRTQARSPVRTKSFVDASAQTDPVRILPIVEERAPPAATQSASSSAAWWLQQQAAPAQQAASASSDQFMMQAYIDAMQRMGQQPPQSSSYGYWTGQHQAPPPQAASADLYWQQNVYQAGPGRFPSRR